MTSDLHEGPLEASPVIDAPAKASWREKRYQRRRRRVWFEEIMGWVLVPVIVVGFYWLIDMVLNAMGTSPAAIIEGIGMIASNL